MSCVQRNCEMQNVRVRAVGMQQWNIPRGTLEQCSLGNVTRRGLILLMGI